MLLLSRSFRLSHHLQGYSQLRLPQQQRQQMTSLWRHCRSATYCVELTLRRLCSTQPSEPKPKKTKRAKKSETKNKREQSSEGTLTAEGDETPPKKRKKKAKGEGKKKTQAELFAEHVAGEPASVQELLLRYDNQLGRAKQSPETFYILNESIADRVVRHLAGRELDVPHLEVGPGPGVLTGRLLDAGVRQIAGFEPTAAFQHCVRALSEQTDGAVRLAPLSLMKLSKFYGAAEHGDERRARQVQAGITPRPWTDGPCLRVVGVAHRSIFFQFLVRSIIGREHLFQLGRPELLVFVPELEYSRLTAGPSLTGRVYRPHSIVSRMLFDLEELDRVPAKHFYPWMKPRKEVRFPETEMVLIRYTPKKDPGVPESELPNLDFFVRQCAVSKTRRIVPQMEEWVPGCGPRLIALGHGVFSPFRELEPDEILKLFLEFTSWPEYPASPFHVAVQQNVLGGESELADPDHLAAEDAHEEAEEEEESFETEPFR